MLRTIALAALGYVGYKYYQKNGDSLRKAFNDGIDRASAGLNGGAADADIDVAGGPLSNKAHVVHAGDPLTT